MAPNSSLENCWCRAQAARREALCLGGKLFDVNQVLLLYLHHVLLLCRPAASLWVPQVLLGRFPATGNVVLGGSTEPHVDYLILTISLCCQPLCNSSCILSTSNVPHTLAIQDQAFIGRPIILFSGGCADVNTDRKGLPVQRSPWQMYEEHIERGDVFRLDIIPAGSSGKQLFPVTFK